MPLLAIARIINDRTMAERRGWETGFRLIDQETEEIRDIPDAVIKKGLEQGIKVCNLKCTAGNIKGIVRSSGMMRNSDIDNSVKFPVVTVTPNGETSALNCGVLGGRKSLWILSIGEVAKRSKIGWLRVCDEFGRKVMQISSLEAGKINILNPEAENNNTGHPNAIAVNDFVETQLNYSGLSHKEAKDYMERSRMIGARHMIMADRPDGSAAVIGISGEKGIGKIDFIVPDYVTAIGKGVFAKIENAGTIYVGGNVKHILENTFIYTDADQIIFGKGVQYIAGKAFYKCSIGRMEIPEGVVLSHNALSFMNCGELIIKTEHIEGVADNNTRRATNNIVLGVLEHSVMRILTLHRRTAEEFISDFLIRRRKWKEIKQRFIGDSKIIDEVDKVISNEFGENTRMLYKISDEILRDLIVGLIKTFYEEAIPLRNTTIKVVSD